MTNNVDPSDQSPSGFSAGFLLGLVVGGAGGYFLTTEQGRALLKTITTQAGDKLESLQDNDIVKSILGELKEIPEVKEALIASTKTKLNQAASAVADATAHKKPAPKRRLFFQSGSPVKK